MKEVRVLLLSIIKTEIQRHLSRRQIIIAFILMIVFLAQGFGTHHLRHQANVSIDSMNSYLAFLDAAGKGPKALLCGIFPLAIALAAGDSLAWDIRSGFELPILMRTTYKKYILGKVLSASIVSFSFVFITELFAFVVALFMFPYANKIVYVPGISPDYATELFVNHPFFYVLLIICNTALFSIVVTSVSILLSTVVKNIYIVVAVPWLLFFALQFLFYGLGMNRYAPLDLVGLYMNSGNHYGTLEIPSMWIILWVMISFVIYITYINKFKVRAKMS